jgi:hypothetical protein
VFPSLTKKGRGDFRLNIPSPLVGEGKGEGGVNRHSALDAESRKITIIIMNTITL